MVPFYVRCDVFISSWSLTELFCFLLIPYRTRSTGSSICLSYDSPTPRLCGVRVPVRHVKRCTRRYVRPGVVLRSTDSRHQGALTPASALKSECPHRRPRKNNRSSSPITLDADFYDLLAATSTYAACAGGDETVDHGLPRS
jgi:hypothetical protein